MEVQFNAPVTINKVTYGKGTHVVPEADVLDNWFFDGLVKEGNAVILRADVPVVEPESETEEVVPVKRGRKPKAD